MGKRPTARSYSRQSVRQRTAKSPVGRSRRGRRRKSLYVLLKLAFQFFRRHTAVLWLVVGALLVGTISAAVMTIVDPTASVLPQAPSQAPTAQAPVQASVEGNQDRAIDQSPSRTAPSLEPLTPSELAPSKSESRDSKAASPISAGSLLLLSCAGGCFFLSQWLRPAKPHPSLQQSTKRKTAARSKPQQASPQMPSIGIEPNLPADSLPASQSRTVQEIQPIALPDTPDDRNPLHATSELPDFESPDSELPEAEPAIQATVVPAHQDHPLDWDEPSLADNLDLRQRRPLSYWL